MREVVTAAVAAAVAWVATLNGGTGPVLLTLLPTHGAHLSDLAVLLIAMQVLLLTWWRPLTGRRP